MFGNQHLLYLLVFLFFPLRLDQLIFFYGSYAAAVLHGVPYIRQLFPQLGISAEEFDADFLHDDEYPGYLSLYDFVVTSGHHLDDMLLLLVNKQFSEISFHFPIKHTKTTVSTV